MHFVSYVFLEYIIYRMLTCLVVSGGTGIFCLCACGFFLIREARKKWLKWKQPTFPLYHHFWIKKSSLQENSIPSASICVICCSCNDGYSLLGMFVFETKPMLFLDYLLHKVLAAWHWLPSLDWLWVSVASGEVTFIFPKYEK